MVDDGLVYATDDNFLTTKANRKMLLVGNGTQLGSLTTTYSGQLIFCTTTTSTFPANKLRARLMGNTAWNSIVTESSEYSTTYNTDEATANIGNARQYMLPFTLPSTEKFYVFTGISWKNGSTVNGTVISGVLLRSSNSTPYVAIAQEVTQTGTDTTQRVSNIRSRAVRGGTECYVWMQSSSATSEFRTESATDVCQNRNTFTYDGTPPTSDNSAITAFNLVPLFVAHYRGYS